VFATIARRLVVRGLDTVVVRGRASHRPTVRLAAGALDRARRWVRLDRVEGATVAWTGQSAPEPLWPSDQRRREAYRSSLVQGRAPAASRAVALPPEGLFAYHERGCPHARAAMDLLRERELPFTAVDLKGDAAQQEWLARVTGHEGLPLFVLHGTVLGDGEALREQAESGELARRLGAAPASRSIDTAPRVRLPLVHPTSSPFERDGAEALGSPEAVAAALTGDALVAEVLAVLDACRPLLQADGGDAELMDVRDGVVVLRLTGNCVGCPSAQTTVHQGIERRMRARLPQITAVRMAPEA
jgi:Fe-S cluster biogenesis protein NfuA/glutaredoxin